MKVSEKWLRTWANPSFSTDELVAQITMAGLEVDAVEPVAEAFSGVVVAEVKRVEPHPDADKLRVCQVSNGEEVAQVVCGAANVREGLKIPFAQVGAVLPGDFKIKKAKLRGVESFGMLCGASELGLEDVIDGLMELPDDAPVGTDFRTYLDLDDNIIDVDLTPNRGDCLSVRGIAREISVLNAVLFNQVEVASQPVTSDKTFNVVIDAADDCPRYAGRVVEGIDVSKPSPLWLQEKLRRSGIRSIDAVVDITNYVLLELGQPMHAFDLDQLQGSIHVRKAAEGEKLTLLDDQELTLRAEDLVIADESKALALAGIMGGKDSGVSDATTSIFLESAFFEPVLLAGRARHFGLHTDSSHRFERGVDWDLQVEALERATELILSIVGGQAGPIVEVKAKEKTLESFELTYKKLTQVLGFDIEREKVDAYLTGLGVSTESTDAGWHCTPPSFRFDLAIEADLIEEVARLYGYNNLPVTPLELPANFELELETKTPLIKVKEALATAGFQEAITYSFTSGDLQQHFSDVPSIEVQNPISQDMAVMRQSLLPGLLSALQHNLNRQMPDVRLFESGLTFKQADGDYQQAPKLAGLLSGLVEDENWSGNTKPADFYDLKGQVDNLLNGLSLSDIVYKPAEPKGYHPGQTAEVFVAGEAIGFVGALHPQVLKSLGIGQPVFVFEISLDILKKGEPIAFASLSKFPSVRRDLAFVVSDSVNASELMSEAQHAAGEWLIDCILFDLYAGAGVEEGKKSLALGLFFQHPERSLNDEEVQQAMDAVVETLGRVYGAALRN